MLALKVNEFDYNCKYAIINNKFRWYHEEDLSSYKEKVFCYLIGKIKFFLLNNSIAHNFTTKQRLNI